MASVMALWIRMRTRDEDSTRSISQVSYLMNNPYSENWVEDYKITEPSYHEPIKLEHPLVQGETLAQKNRQRVTQNNNKPGPLLALSCPHRLVHSYEGIILYNFFKIYFTAWQQFPLHSPFQWLLPHFSVSPTSNILSFCLCLGKGSSPMNMGCRILFFFLFFSF